MTLFTQRKSWSAAALGPVFASLTRRLLPSVPEGGTSRTYGLPCIKKELRKPSFPYIIFWDKEEEAAAYLAEQIKGETVDRWLYDRKRDGSLWDPQKNNEVIWHWEQGPDARIRAKKNLPCIHTERNAAARPVRSSTLTEAETVFPRAYWTETSILCDRKK